MDKALSLSKQRMVFDYIETILFINTEKFDMQQEIKQNDDKT